MPPVPLAPSFASCTIKHCHQVYQEEKEVAAMMDLRMAYENNDLARFQRTLLASHDVHTTVLRRIPCRILEHLRSLFKACRRSVMMFVPAWRHWHQIKCTVTTEFSVLHHELLMISKGSTCSSESGGTFHRLGVVARHLQAFNWLFGLPCMAVVKLTVAYVRTGHQW